MTFLEKAIAESKEREEKATKEPWYAVKQDMYKYKYRTDDWETDEAFTVSPNQNELGWENDSGCRGYGISKDNAEFISSARTWEPKWREMMEIAQDALEKIMEISNDNIIGMYVGPVLEKLERLAKEWLEK